MSIKQNTNEEIIIDFLGDLCLSWYTLDKEIYLKVIKKINEYFGKVDYRIANLESPFLCDKNPTAILKEGLESNLGTDEKYIDFIANLNVNAYTLANNHLGDFGEKGIRDTISVLKKLNKDYTGTSSDYKDIYKPLRIEIKKCKFSFISICENEFGIAKNNKVGVAGFNCAIIKKVIEEEQAWADFKIIIFHGGTEYYPFPTPNQKQRYHWLIDIGADLVIGMHQHCPVGYEVYHNALIVYGLGNFFFPRKTAILYKSWNIGYVARLIIKLDKIIDFRPIPFKFDNDGKKFCGIDINSFNKFYAEISKPINDDIKLEELYKGWVSYSGKKHYEILKYCIINDENIYSNNIVKNLLSCEAHNELLTTYLNLRYYEKKMNYNNEFKKLQQYMNFGYFEEEITNNEDEQMDKCVLWGVSEKTEKIYKELKNIKCKIIVIDKDFYKQGFYFFDSKIYSPDDIIPKNRDAIYYICTSKIHIEEIKTYLLLANIPEQRIIVI